MMRSMFSGVAGLRNHQTMMDVLSSNIANVNTFGYKASRTTFKDTLYQNLSGAAAPSGALGGTNAKQIGLGMTLNSIDNLMTQGAAQTTGVQTDLMIQGDGYFRVSSSAATWNADDTKVEAAGAAENYTRAGNFSFDAQGYLVTQNGEYVVGDVDPGTAGIQTGRLRVNPAAFPSAISVDSSGTLSFVAGVAGAYGPLGAAVTAGQTVTMGQISLATFPNQPGLQRLGANLWGETNNSGVPNMNQPGNGGAGTVLPGALEMSNVDLALEFTNMIIAQRGFQANSRAITTSDEMLGELVNLKR
jgi:flagellar hook protein FlgE